MSSKRLTYQRDDETSGERLDRHWDELLQELRLVQTGTQILFAFLLGIAFQNQFHTADQFTHTVYACTLLAAALAVALFLAPVSVHRLLYRKGLRDQLVTVTDRLARGGMTFLVAAICGGVLIALDVVLPRPAAIALVVGVLVWFVVFWLAIPAYLRHRHAASDSSPGGREPGRYDCEAE
ncbi:hypothetical protein EV645_3938 [Kribbella rubisoli]|uniref:Sodium:proton antiporter n=1 Tax=Kribbella rubisoli TaxID=3075929 RepID=A0A4Q7X2Z6_9ACTN|nr:DUF6328 family protein [Kribbella rubisoli]RZU16379.1 hypothetical protein EV645_3938 [Kribbella rubisoli]